MKTEDLKIFQSFWSMQKKIVYIFVLVIILNVVFTQVIFNVQDEAFADSMNFNWTIVGNVFSMIITICVVTAALSVSYHFCIMVSLGVPRNRVVKSIVKYMAAFTGLWAALVNLVFYLIVHFNTQGFLFPLIGGINFNNWSLVIFIKTFAVLWMFCAVIAFLSLWISTVFMRYGAIWGLVHLALLLSVPLFFLGSIVDMIMWGIYPRYFGLILVTIVLFCIGGSSLLLQRVELKK